jgi:transposase-like protein
MTNPTKTRRRFTAQQKAEAVALCLSEGLSCTAVAQRLGLPNSSLAKWVRHARIDRGDFAPAVQGQLTSEERAELAQLHRENREPTRAKDFSGWRQLTLQKSSCRREVSPDRVPGGPFSVAWLCRQLGVARSGFYACLLRQQNRAVGPGKTRSSPPR